MTILQLVGTERTLLTKLLMMDSPQQHNPNRRGSLSLSQTLSLDWTPPPPPANLEQIHASSSQAPGLTSFTLGSPPGGNTEQLSFNRIYSRVKSFAGAVRDVVGGSGSASSSPTKSVLSGKVGSDRYYQQSASRDSFLSIATASDDGMSQLSPTKSSILAKGHLRQHSLSSLQSRGSSRASNGSITGADYAQPSALRKVNLLAATPRATTNPSVAQVTVFRGGVETPLDGGASVNVSRNGSISSLRDVSANNASNSGTPNITVGAFVGAIGNVIGSTAGFSTSASGNTTHMMEGAGRNGDNSFVDADEDFDDSASDGTLSDSSDDDVVMLHSKLPAGSAGGRPRQEGACRKGRTGKASDPKAKIRPSVSITANKDSKPEFKDRLLLPPPATSDSPTAPDANMLTPSESAQSVHVISPQVSAKSNSNLPQLSALNLQSKASNRVSPRPPSTTPDLRKEAMRKRRPPTDQTLLLPGFKITGDRSSDADSSPAGTSMTATEQKGEATSSVCRQGGFGDGKVVSGVHGGGITGSTEAVSQALRQLRMGNLTRDFWMKDEVCKDCFLCGSTFSAWRRKHHCREFPTSFSRTLVKIVCRTLWSDILFEMHYLDIRRQIWSPRLHEGVQSMPGHSKRLSRRIRF